MTVVQPPVPQPRRFSLIETAQDLTPADPHWENGIDVWPQPCALPFTQDPCATGTNRAITYGTLPAGSHKSVFSVIMGVKCTGASVGRDDAAFVQRFSAAFQAVEAFAVEREFEQGVQFPSEPHLTNNPSPPTRPVGNVAQSPVEGLVQLEMAIAATGRAGIIHSTVAVATQWRRLGVVTQEGQRGQARLVTAMGTEVIAGAGYQGATPSGGDAAVGQQDWAYATGLVGYARGQLERVPDNITQALSRSDNTYQVFIARPYALVADWCVHAAVKIDRATT